MPKTVVEEQPKEQEVQDEVSVEENPILSIGNEGGELILNNNDNDLDNNIILNVSYEANNNIGKNINININNGNELNENVLSDENDDNLIDMQPEQEKGMDIFPDQMEKPPLFYIDPELSEEEKNEQAILQSLDEESDLNKSMIVERPKRGNVNESRKRKTKSSSSKKSSSKNPDLKRVNKEMKPVAGLNINVQKLPERKKPGFSDVF